MWHLKVQTWNLCSLGYRMPLLCEKLFFIYRSCCQLLSTYSRGLKSRNEPCIILDWLEYYTAGGWKWDLPSKDCLQCGLLCAAFTRSHTERKHTLWPHDYIFINNSFDDPPFLFWMLLEWRSREEIINFCKKIGGLAILGPVKDYRQCMQAEVNLIWCFVSIQHSVFYKAESF